MTEMASAVLKVAAGDFVHAVFGFAASQFPENGHQSLYLLNRCSAGRQLKQLPNLFHPVFHDTHLF